MFSLEDYIAQKCIVIDEALLRHLPAKDERPAILHEAMHYAVFSGGKRLRPVLCMAAAEAVGGNFQEAVVPGIAIEALHAYTLVHDDLPAMDDDDVRRGKPTCHVQFGEANAILAGDALLTAAFEWMAQAVAPPPYQQNQLSLELAEAAGSKGIIAGQVEDLLLEQGQADEQLLGYVHAHKTAALIRASVRIGAVSGGAAPSQLDAISAYGQNIGMAFQLIDDALDNGPAVSVYGKKGAEHKARALCSAAKESLRTLSGDATPLEKLADFIVERTN